MIDTIGSAYAALLAMPTLFALPLVLDAYLWLGLRLSPGSLSTRSGRLGDALDRVGVGDDLTPLALLLVPSLLAGAGRENISTGWGGVSADLASPLGAVLLIVGLVLLGVGLGVAYRVPLAYRATLRPLQPRAVVRSVLVGWVRVVGLFAGLVAVTVFVLLPVVAAGLIGLALGVNILPPLVLLTSLPLLATLFFLYFALDAVVVGEVGPLRAAYLSVNVVRRNARGTLGLAACVLLVSSGLPVVWLGLAGSPFGLVVALVGHALTATGLTLAGTLFFADRVRRWRPDALAPVPLAGSS